MVIGGGQAELTQDGVIPCFIISPVFFSENGSEFALLALCAIHSSPILPPSFCSPRCFFPLHSVLYYCQVNIPKVKINPDFKKEYRFLSQEKNDKLRADAEKFLKENLDNANNFINLLSLREMILYNTMYAIMDMQKAYFLSGNEFDLKPMVLKDIAEKVNLDISTISRVTSSKYVQAPFGILLIKNLFSEAVGDEDVSSKAIKKILSEIIEQEDKSDPLPDEQLCAQLKEKGYDIARRTVAKYREQLGLPVARLRREIQF